MITDESDSKGSGFEPTRIDLGDDLIEKTAIIPGQTAPENPPNDGLNSKEQLQNARILLNEGFPEEAKRVLRQVLLADEAQLEARKLLEEIHEIELKQMFGTAESAVRKSFLENYDDSILEADSDEVVRILDRDIGLDLKDAAKDLSLFSDPKLLNAFADQLDHEVGSSVPDRIDLVVAFVEMGLYPVAIRLLQCLLVSEDEATRLNATALLAHAHLQNDEPYRTLSALQPVLNDSDIDRRKKTECFYMMGRAQQVIGRCAEAVSWYFQAQENEPGYRDTAERITRCRAAQTRGG